MSSEHVVRYPLSGAGWRATVKYTPEDGHLLASGYVDDKRFYFTADYLSWRFFVEGDDGRIDEFFVQSFHVNHATGDFTEVSVNSAIDQGVAAYRGLEWDADYISTMTTIPAPAVAA